MEKINKCGRYKTAFPGEGNIVFLDAQKELVLYRIAQEALNNVLKHASAYYISIKLKYDTNRVSLFIEDDGAGFDSSLIDKKTDLKINSGLDNMRSRAAMLNGSFEINGSAGNGTKICVTAPY